MRLLTPVQVKELREQEKVKELYRTKELDEAADKSRKNLAKVEADFNDTLANNREKWAKEELEHENRLKEREFEVKALEKRKDLAQEVIDFRTRSAQEQLDKANTLLASNTIKEEENQEIADRLEEKLDLVGQKEQDLIKQEQQMQIKKESIDLQTEQTKDGIKKLNKDLAAFYAHRETLTKELNARKTELDLKDINLENKIISLEEKEVSLKAWDLRLHDKEVTLKIAYDNLKKTSPLKTTE